MDVKSRYNFKAPSCTPALFEQPNFSVSAYKLLQFDIVRLKFLNRGFSKYRLKNSFKKFALNHHDVVDIKYSMEEINEFIRSHFT